MSSSSSPSLEVLAAMFVEYLPAPQRHHESLRTAFTPAARPFSYSNGYAGYADSPLCDFTLVLRL